MNPAWWILIGIVALNLYALLLILLRGPIYRTRIYRPMILNIGLSLAPAIVLGLTAGVLLLIIQAAPAMPGIFGGLFMFATIAAGGLIWLLLLPNAAYLITELNLSHRRPGDDVPIWYDIMLALTLALSGVFNTLGNVALVQLFWVAITDQEYYATARSPIAWIGLALTLLAVAFGIYLGRHLRFNSWDLIHPTSMIKKLYRHFFRTKGNIGAALGFTLTHAILLLILYLIVMFPALNHLLER